MTDLAAAAGRLAAKWAQAAALARTTVTPETMTSMLAMSVTLDACAAELAGLAAVTDPAAGPEPPPAPEADGGFADSVRASAEAFAASVIMHQAQNEQEDRP